MTPSRWCVAASGAVCGSHRNFLFPFVTVTLRPKLWVRTVLRLPSVALNPIIKFTTLFGLLAVEMAVAAPRCLSLGLGVSFFLIGLIFVWRSFYRMRISSQK